MLQLQPSMEQELLMESLLLQQKKDVQESRLYLTTSMELTEEDLDIQTEK